MRTECRGLINELLRFELSGVPNHQAVIGSRGSGKTLMVRYLQRVIPQHNGIEILYANCRHYNTSFKLLAQLLHVQARGTNMAELFERFCLTYRKKTVIALDEVDVMSPKDRRRMSNRCGLSKEDQPRRGSIFAKASKGRASCSKEREVIRSLCGCIPGRQ